MRDDYTGGAVLYLLMDSPGKILPDSGCHVLREDRCKRDRAVVGDLFQFGNRSQDIVCIELARDRAGPVIDPARDRASGGDDGKGREVPVLDNIELLWRHGSRPLSKGAGSRWHTDIITGIEFDDCHTVALG